MFGNWKFREPLNDKELLAAAEQAAIELENIPLDNNVIIDEEESEDEIGEGYEVKNTNMYLVEEETKAGNADTDQDKIFEIEIEAENKIIQSQSLDTETQLEQSEATSSGVRNESYTKEKKMKNNRGKKVIKTKIEESTRKWKKRRVITSIPEYNNNETPVEEHFINCITYTDFFLKVLSPSIIKDIVYQSNLYATQRGKTMNFKENEFLTFLGINFFMGYHKLPSYKNYWSCSDDLGVAVVKRVMTRSRFEQFLQYLHINDNSIIPANNKDKIFKIRPFVKALNEQFDLLNNGTRALSVDESMIIFKGRSCLKQYNPQKPIKRGYKLWCIADQKGYVKKFEV
ncbi:hypothetical protein NQ317_002985 [Molorchus minor]|uniref:PiggyBac transposable element-derived protein domain-containing protein n=1 Tax=Molorchus minor TaxID=1323400 RepID=A0ABQ9IX11_9CUCU|nr:hypothetical protein NQ317_002985 [Molorchus minor]